MLFINKGIDYFNRRCTKSVSKIKIIYAFIHFKLILGIQMRFKMAWKLYRATNYKEVSN